MEHRPIEGTGYLRSIQIDHITDGTARGVWRVTYADGQNIIQRLEFELPTDAAMCAEDLMIAYELYLDSLDAEKESEHSV